MRILQVVHGFPPKQKTGTETLTYNLSKELSKKHEVHVFHPVYENRRTPQLIHKRKDGLHLHELIMGEHVLKKMWRFVTCRLPRLSCRNHKAERVFNELLTETKPTIVHFQHLIGLSVSLPIIASKYCPTVLALNDYWLICPTTHFLTYDGSVCNGFSPENCSKCFTKLAKKYLETKFKSNKLVSNSYSKFVSALHYTLFKRKVKARMQIVKQILELSDKIIAPSKTIVKKFIENGFFDEELLSKTRIIPHGVDASSLMRVVKAPPDRLRFGYVGGISERKGVHVLIEAFKEIKDMNIELRIYGNFNPTASSYHRVLLLKSRDIPNIKFMGPFDGVREPYSSIDALVVPSITYEGYGLVVQEAFAAKVPVIASDIGALNEFVRHMENGSLFEVGDPQDLAEKMRVLAESPELLKNLVKGIPKVRSIEEHATEIEKMYKEVLNSERRRKR